MVHNMLCIIKIKCMKRLGCVRSKVHPHKGKNIFRSGYCCPAMFDSFLHGTCPACMNQANIVCSFRTDALDLQQTFIGLLKNIKDGFELFQKCFGGWFRIDTWDHVCQQKFNQFIVGKSLSSGSAKTLP